MAAKLSLFSSAKKKGDGALPSFACLVVALDGSSVHELISVEVDDQAKSILLRSVSPLLGEGGFRQAAASYAGGGAPLLAAFVSQRLGREIGQYLLFGFETVQQAVDLVGGVELSLKSGELAPVNAQLEALCARRGVPLGENLLPEGSGGSFSLNGLQTAAFLMSAQGDSAQRLHRLLSALKPALKGIGAHRLLSLADLVFPSLHTNIPKTEMFSYLMNIKQYLQYSVRYGE